MKSFAIRSLGVALAVVIVSAGVARASGPERENHSHNSSKSKSTSTVTELESKAKLVGSGTQATATGYAESKVITVTNKTTNVSTTNSSVSVSVKGLKLADGVVVTFQVDSKTLGTAVVRRGRASIRLSTKTGAIVPVVAQGSTVTVLDGGNVDLTGIIGAAVAETEGNEGSESHGR